MCSVSSRVRRRGSAPVSPHRRDHRLDETFAVELVGADIDGKGNRVGRRVVGEAAQRPARALQHEFVEGLRQSVPFGQRDELIRIDVAALGVVPTHQGLGRETAPIGIELRLVDQLEAAGVEGFAELGHQGQPLVGKLLHARLEEAERPAARRLRLIHGKVGALEEIVDLDLGAAEERDADARRSVEGVAVELERQPHCRQDARREPLHDNHSGVEIERQALHHDDELVAAKPGDHVVAAHGLA